MGHVHTLRSEGRHRPRAKGLGLQTRSAFFARQLQQPYPDRRLHPLRHEAEKHFPADRRCQHRFAREIAGEVSATVSLKKGGLPATRRNPPQRYDATNYLSANNCRPIVLKRAFWSSLSEP